MNDRRRLLMGGLLGTMGCLHQRGRRSDAGFGGRRSRWAGYDRHDFVCDGRPATVVVPTRRAPGAPWLWRGEFWGAFANTDQALLARGWHLAYLQCKDTFGHPRTLDHWDVFYDLLTRQHGLARRPVLLGVSRGGLYVYRWAARHPDRVGLIYGDAPVCDVKSWPGGKGKGRGSPRDWRAFQQVYGLTEAAALEWNGNPIDLLEPIARAGIPLLHVVGDADDVVPVQENTAVLKQRYEALGGKFHLIVKPGVGHHPHGLADPTPIVAHIERHRLR